MRYFKKMTASGRMVAGFRSLVLLGAASACVWPSLAMAGVEYALRANASLGAGAYTVYARSDEYLSGTDSMVGSAQATIILPDGSIPRALGGGADYKVTDSALTKGTWNGSDTSQDVGPEDLNVTVPADVFQVQMAPTGPKIPLEAGVEVELFSFVLEGSCQGLRLLENSEPFGAVPNRRMLSSPNSWDTVRGEKYVGNYDTDQAVCFE